MSDARQPGYDFYAVAPPAPPEPPSAVRFGSAGAPDTPLGAAAAYRPSFLLTVTPPRSPTPRWVIAMIAGLCAGYVGVIGLSVAVPVFLAQRAKARLAATAVQVPGTFQGADRTANPRLDALAAKAHVSGFGPVDAGVFPARRDRSVMIVAARATDPFLPESAQATAREQVVDGLATEPLSDPGRDGEVRWGCAPASGGATVCVSTDRTALVAVVLGKGVRDPHAVARSARQATIHRT